mmetsp:Transcript_65324/g.188120  ORF Transcript_65324/g.188120 Transcript_65324/m.188120 type:complete len:312 (+) Transcript_65324:613-1548(+)
MHGAPRGYDRGAVVHPIELDEFLLGSRQLRMVSVELVLYGPTHSGPERHRGEHGEGKHEVAGPHPNLAIVALQVEGTRQCQRHDVEDDWARSELALEERQLEDACQHRRGPIRTAAEDHALAEAEPPLLQDGFDGPDEWLVNAHRLPNPLVIAQALADQLLLHSASRELQQEAQDDANTGTPPEAERALVRDDETAEQVDGRARHGGQHKKKHAGAEGHHENDAEVQRAYDRAHPREQHIEEQRRHLPEYQQVADDVHPLGHPQPIPRHHGVELPLDTLSEPSVVETLVIAQAAGPGCTPLEGVPGAGSAC